MLAPSAPKNVKAAAENTTAIRVFWQEPDQPHGKIKKYTVVTHKVPDGGRFEPVNCNNTGTLTADKHAHTCLKPRWRFSRAQRAIN
jgi:hypothetical protein